MSAEVGRGSAIVFLSLPDDAVVREVLFAPDGLVHGLAAGSVVVDTSTIAAASAREFASALAARGIPYYDLAKLAAGHTDDLTRNITRFLRRKEHVCASKFYR